MKKNLAEEFFNLFSGLTLGYGKMMLKETFKDSGKQEAYHQVVKEKLTVESWEGHFNGEHIGVVPIRDDGTSCKFGAIDIDAYDNFSFSNLMEKIERLELPLVVCRSKSGGAHCYLFMSEPVPAQIVHTKLREWASAIGYASNRRGEPTEIFPKQVKLLIEKGDVGSFINMPYADGEKTNRYAMTLIAGNVTPLTMEQFLKMANDRAQTYEQLKESTIPMPDIFHDGPPCLQLIVKAGVNEGGRNNALLSMGVYFKMAYPDSWQDKIEDANHKYLESPLPSKEVTNIIKSVNKKDYMYPCKVSPLVDHCNRSVCMGRKFGVGTSFGDAPVLDTLQKINTTPPSYILGMINRLGFPISVLVTSDDLLSAKRIKKVCVESMDYLPFIPAQDEWEKLLQQVMERMTIVEMPEDSSSSGQLWHHLKAFLSRKGKSSNLKELLNGRPVTDRDKIYFRMVDFSGYLEQSHFKLYRPHEVAAIFRQRIENGQMGHATKNISGQCVQLWYMLKSELTNITLDVPEDIQDDDVY